MATHLRENKRDGEGHVKRVRGKVTCLENHVLRPRHTRKWYSKFHLRKFARYVVLEADVVTTVRGLVGEILQLKF